MGTLHRKSDKEEIKMNDFEYKVSVIIPVYNAEKSLAECMESLVRQSLEKDAFEVIAIDDGSKDKSVEICKLYQGKCNLSILQQENNGVSVARNNGIKHAKGKYLLYLDSDDTLREDTLKEVVSFFDENYDKIDILTYPIVFIDKYQNEMHHYREKYLEGQGIYNITDMQFLNLTTVNVVVKNLRENNVLFDETLKFHEDELYIADVVMKHKCYGFISKGEYRYVKNDTNVTNNQGNPYYNFESTIMMYESLLKRYCKNGEVSPYIQSLIYNDFVWKLATDELYPRHYDKEQYQQALDRIKRIIEHFNINLLFDHPATSLYKAFYFLNMCHKKEVKYRNDYGNYSLYLNDKLIYTSKKIDIVCNRFSVTDKKIEIIGYLKSPIFMYINKPQLYMEINGQKEEIPLYDSSWSYFQTKEKTSQFWGFHINIPLEEKLEISFIPCYEGDVFKYTYYFMPQVKFNYALKRMNFVVKDRLLECTGNKIWCSRVNKDIIERVKREADEECRKRRKKFWLVRKATRFLQKKERKIWLYYDCKGVKKDNGYYQFIHDFDKKDGIERYYITNNPKKFNKGLFDKKQKHYVVSFGSVKHKFLYLLCEKVITAFIEQNNYMPYDWNTFQSYIDLTNFEIVYLQHGVLHAHLPWKYSLDRLQISREVISTKYELENMTKNYGFGEENLIPCGMPRYDFMDLDKKDNQKKILLAPSWRKYLVGVDENGDWSAKDKDFLKSEYYMELSKFLKSEKLQQILKSSGYKLELKLHPIFSMYKKHFNFLNDQISLAQDSVNLYSYQLFITDISSFYFDFLYLERPVMYFVPDRIKFDAGLNDYRELDIPFEDGFGPYCETANEAIDILEQFLNGTLKEEKKYKEKMHDLFFYYDNRQRDRLYEALMEKE